MLPSGHLAARFRPMRTEAVYGGAPMPAATMTELAERLPHLIRMKSYGSTATMSHATLMPPGRNIGRIDGVGCPLPCAEIRVMDEADAGGRACAP